MGYDTERRLRAAAGLPDPRRLRNHPLTPEQKLACLKRKLGVLTDREFHDYLHGAGLPSEAALVARLIRQ